VRLQVAEQYGEGTVVAIDPGNTEQASTRTGGNSETPERINRDLTPYQLVSRDQWRHEVGVNELNNKVAEARQNRALDQPGGALHGGGSVMSLKVATAAAAAGALRARRFHFVEIYKALTSKPLKRLRRTNKRRRASAIDRLINWFLGRDNKHSQLPAAPVIANQSKVKLVLIGDGSRMNGYQGHQELGPVGGAAPPVRAARPERGLQGGAQQRALHVDQVRMLRRAQPQGVQEQGHQLPPRPQGRPQLPAAAVLTPHLLKMRKVSLLERSGRYHQPSARRHLHAQRLGDASMAPPRLRLSNNNTHVAAYPRPGRDEAYEARCPT
jgi:hypothetical protein